MSCPPRCFALLSLQQPCDGLVSVPPENISNYLFFSLYILCGKQSKRVFLISRLATSAGVHEFPSLALRGAPALLRARAASKCPNCAARWRGVALTPVLRRGLAPSERRYLGKKRIYCAVDGPRKESIVVAKIIIAGPQLDWF